MRDPKRIPLILGAVERAWRQDPDARLGQLIVTLLRRNRDLRDEDEGKALFAMEYGELLSWIGADTEDERRYVEQEPRERRVRRHVVDEPVPH